MLNKRIEGNIKTLIGKVRISISSSINFLRSSVNAKSNNAKSNVADEYRQNPSITQEVNINQDCSSVHYQSSNDKNQKGNNIKNTKQIKKKEIVDAAGGTPQKLNASSSSSVTPSAAPPAVVGNSQQVTSGVSLQKSTGDTQQGTPTSSTPETVNGTKRDSQTSGNSKVSSPTKILITPSNNNTGISSPAGQSIGSSAVVQLIDEHKQTKAELSAAVSTPQQLNASSSSSVTPSAAPPTVVGNSQQVTPGVSLQKSTGDTQQGTPTSSTPETVNGTKRDSQTSGNSKVSSPTKILITPSNNNTGISSPAGQSIGSSAVVQLTDEHKQTKAELSAAVSTPQQLPDNRAIENTKSQSQDFFIIRFFKWVINICKSAVNKIVNIFSGQKSTNRSSTSDNSQRGGSHSEITTNTQKPDKQVNKLSSPQENVGPRSSVTGVSLRSANTQQPTSYYTAIGK